MPDNWILSVALYEITARKWTLNFLFKKPFMIYDRWYELDSTLLKHRKF